jgi:thiol-disulfide isomerase/thioredoxin
MPSNIVSFSGDKAALIQQVQDAKGVVAIDFHALWCPSCRRLGQLLPAIASDFPNVLFLKADIAECKALAMGFGLQRVPHVKFLKIGPNQELIELGSTNGSSGPLVREKLAEYAK